MSVGALSVTEFCSAFGISKAHLYNLVGRGEGPVLLKAGRRTLISSEAAAEWQRRMEALASAPQTPKSR
jgi:Helix-turn-helix domain